MLYDEAGDIEIYLYGTEAEALKDAAYKWDMLTDSEKSRRTDFYVGFGRVTSDDMEAGCVGPGSITRVIRSFK